MTHTHVRWNVALRLDCCCRLALNVDMDDVVHMLKTDTSIAWLPQLNL